LRTPALVRQKRFSSGILGAFWLVIVVWGVAASASSGAFAHNSVWSIVLGAAIACALTTVLVGSFVRLLTLGKRAGIEIRQDGLFVRHPKTGWTDLANGTRQIAWREFGSASVERIRSKGFPAATESSFPLVLHLNDGTSIYTIGLAVPAGKSAAPLVAAQQAITRAREAIRSGVPAARWASEVRAVMDEANRDAEAARRTRRGST